MRAHDLLPKNCVFNPKKLVSSGTALDSRSMSARQSALFSCVGCGEAGQSVIGPSMEATEERTLKITSGTHGWFTFHASVRRFGLELDRQPAAYLLAVCPRTFSLPLFSLDPTIAFR